MSSEDRRDDEWVLTYRTPSGEPPSKGVVEAVSAVAGVDPLTDLDPLYSVIDPDALDALFRNDGTQSGRNPNRLTFNYHGFEVTVHDDTNVSVRRSDTTSGESAD